MVMRSIAASPDRHRCSRQFAADSLRRRHQAAGLERSADRRSSAPDWRRHWASVPEAMVLRCIRWRDRGPACRPHRCRARYGSRRNAPRNAPGRGACPAGAAPQADAPTRCGNRPACRPPPASPYGRAAGRNIRCIGRDRCRARRLRSRSHWSGRGWRPSCRPVAAPRSNGSHRRRSASAAPAGPPECESRWR